MFRFWALSHLFFSSISSQPRNVEAYLAYGTAARRRVAVTRIILHPNYRFPANDLALLQVLKFLEFYLINVSIRIQYRFFQQCIETVILLYVR